MKTYINDSQGIVTVNDGEGVSISTPIVATTLIVDSILVNSSASIPGMSTNTSLDLEYAHIGIRTRLTGTIEISGSTEIDGYTKIHQLHADNICLSGSLYTTSSLSFRDVTTTNLISPLTSSLSGVINLSGTLFVDATNPVSIGNLNTTNLDVKGVQSITGSINVEGNISSSNVLNASSIYTTNIGISGSLSLANPLTVQTLYATDVGVSGSLSLANPATIKTIYTTDLSISGTLLLTSSLNLSNDLTASNAKITNTLSASNITLGSTITAATASLNILSASSTTIASINTSILSASNVVINSTASGSLLISGTNIVQYVFGYAWDDIQGTFDQGSGTAALTFETYKNFDLLFMRHDQNDAITMRYQMPHNWAKTNVRPHLHIMPTNVPGAGSLNVDIGYQAAWLPGFGRFPTTWTTGSILIQISSSMRDQHLIAPLLEMPSTTGSMCSDILLLRIVRSGSASPRDTYTTSKTTGTAQANLAILYTDVHYQKDRPGTKDEYAN